ncbi:MAG: PaaI family thioesterase [Myxococcota bacterium]|nr:PaaI family thioesterase [Myxococcota bacterium]
MADVEETNAPEFMNDMGMRSGAVVDGESMLELELAPGHMSRADRAHGGVLFSMLDSALGRAVLSHLPEGRGCATVEMKINYFRPVQHGTIIARGRMKEMTKSLAYAEGEITNDEGKVLARASGTFFLTRTMQQSERERV